MKTNKEALATHLGVDYADLGEYVYQPSRFTLTVYAIDDGYYCASKTGKLPKPLNSNTHTVFNWVEVPDSFINQYGYKIYKHD